MSADLFAEFNEPSKSPQPTTSQPAFGQQSTQAQSQSFGASNDTFCFAQNHSRNDAGFSQPNQPWPSLTAQPTGSGAWGESNPSLAPQPARASAADDDDDDWGDFETSEPKPNSSATQPPQEPSWKTRQEAIQWQSPAPVTIPQEPPRPGVVRASTIDLMTNSLVSAGSLVKPAPAPSIQEDRLEPHARPRLKQEPSDPNVLFDAGDFELEGGGDDLDDDDDDDDDFGDFETVAPAVPPPSAGPSRPATKPTPPSLDLLGLSLDDSAPTEAPASLDPVSLQAPSSGLLSFGATAGAYPTAPKSPSYQQRNPFPDLAVKTPIATEFNKDILKSASPVTAWPTFEPEEAKGTGKYQDDDDWGAWDDMPSRPGKEVVDIDSTKAPQSWDWDTLDNVQPAATSIVADDTPPPTNVPPPSVILSIFPDLLGSVNQLFQPLAGQSVSIKDRILSDPKAVTFLEGYILLATTAAHAIAGRKHRWHRDKILAKSMSISAAGSKGMKLAGVDKTQAAREDREAADVVAVWRDNVGRLRSAVAAAKTAGKASLKVPELSETMQISTAKLAPTAPKPCVICGLKREERVGKVDYEVEDSFGEWWVEHWGHRACKNFWIEHEQKLRQR